MKQATAVLAGREKGRGMGGHGRPIGRRKKEKKAAARPPAPPPTCPLLDLVGKPHRPLSLFQILADVCAVVATSRGVPRDTVTAYTTWTELGADPLAVVSGGGGG